MASHREIVAKREECPVGSWVQSRFRAPWRGVVVELIERTDCTDLARVEIRIDRRGNPMRKPMIKTLDAGWLTPVAAP